MIVTDRPAWSSEDGTKAMPKDSFKLEPNWRWEEEWYRDFLIECDEEVNSPVLCSFINLLSIFYVLSFLISHKRKPIQHTK